MLNVKGKQESVAGRCYVSRYVPGPIRYVSAIRGRSAADFGSKFSVSLGLDGGVVRGYAPHELRRRGERIHPCTPLSPSVSLKQAKPRCARLACAELGKRA